MSKKLIFQNRKIQKIPSKTDHNNLSLLLFQISTQFLLSAYLDLGVYKKSPPPPHPPPHPHPPLGKDRALNWTVVAESVINGSASCEVSEATQVSEATFLSILSGFCFIEKLPARSLVFIVILE